MSREGIKNPGASRCGVCERYLMFPRRKMASQISWWNFLFLPFQEFGSSVLGNPSSLKRQHGNIRSAPQRNNNLTSTLSTWDITRVPCDPYCCPCFQLFYVITLQYTMRFLL